MNIDVGLLSIIILGVMLLMLLTGLPVAFVLLSLSAIGFWILRGPAAITSMAIVTFTYITKDIFIALPTFIFMAAVLEMSGLGSAMYDMMHKWMAGLRGGLAMGTLAIATVIAAMTGSAATATLTMGMLAYPEMEKRGYDKRMIIGAIPAGGSLGPLIPPSVVMIIVAAVSVISIGKLFIAGIIPGLITSLGYISYIGIRCWKNPRMGPPIPVEERVGWGEKFRALSMSILPILLIFLVLGLIYLGVATPSEAGGVGAFGALICAAIYRNLTLKNLQRAITTSLRITAMLMWLLATGACFSQLIGVMGVQSYVRDLLLGLAVEPWVIVIGILGLVYILGMFIDATPIAVIFLPIFYPIILALGLDLLWFGLLFTMDLLIGIMTPPFGMVLFFFKGLNIPGVTMMDIYRSIIPYVLIMTVVMIIVFLVPELAVWLPNQMIK